MVAIKNTNKRGAVGTSMRGAFYTYERNGDLQLNAWPQPRGKAKTDAQKKAEDLFREACIVMKTMCPEFINYARENSKYTPMLPRDALIAMLYGVGPTFVLKNGERLYSMATRVDMSNLLLTLGDEDGMILFLDDDGYWKGLGIGTAGQVLTVNAEDKPSWSDPSGGGGGGGSWLIAPYGNQYTPTSAQLGQVLTPLCDISITQVAFRHMMPSNTNTFYMQVQKLDGSSVVTEITASQQIYPTCDGTQRYESFSFDVPVPISAGQDMAIVLNQRGAGDTGAFKIASASGVNAYFPCNTNNRYCENPKETPAVGQQWYLYSGSPYNINMQG